MWPQPMKTWHTPHMCTSTALGNLTMLCKYNEFYKLRAIPRPYVKYIRHDEAQDHDSFSDGLLGSTHCAGFSVLVLCALSVCQFID